MAASTVTAQASLAGATVLGLRNSAIKMALFPLDVMKLINQYKGFLAPTKDSAFKIIRDRVDAKGWFEGLYIGALFIPIELVLSNWFLYFCKEKIESVFPKNQKKDYITRVMHKVFTGTALTLGSNFLTYPFESMTTIYAVKPPNSFSDLLNILSSRSELASASQITQWLPILSGLYAGFSTLSLEVVLYKAVYNALFEALRPYLKQIAPVKKGKETEYHLAMQTACVSLATIGAGMLSYPIDTIRRYQLIETLQGGDCSILDAIDALNQKGGLHAFYEGAVMNLFRLLSPVIRSGATSYRKLSEAKNEK